MEVLLAMFFAFVLALLMVPVLGTRRPGEAEGTSMAPTILLFFLILFLATWAGGLWLGPVGPTAWGVPWLGFLLIALVITLIIAVASGAGRPYGGGAWATPADTPADTEAEEVAAAGVGIFFWLLMLALVIAIVAAYLT